MAGYLLFIDTNILLDFYRARNDASLKLLEHIDRNSDHIITTYQVEMEFKKNRQHVIHEALKELRKPEMKWSVPAFLKEAKAVDVINRSHADIGKRIASLHQRTARLLAKPTTHDPVYAPIQRMLTSPRPINLMRDNEVKYGVKRRAFRRYILGYPPRKDSDNCIGDAVNWEWMIQCASTHKKGLVIVSRDCDYGTTLEKESYLNDWLAQEFRSRVSKKGQIQLTPRLSDAFRRISVKVSKEEEQEEVKLIEQQSTTSTAQASGDTGLKDLAALLKHVESTLGFTHTVHAFMKKGRSGEPGQSAGDDKHGGTEPAG